MGHLELRQTQLAPAKPSFYISQPREDGYMSQGFEFLADLDETGWQQRIGAVQVVMKGLVFLISENRLPAEMSRSFPSAFPS